MSNLQLKPKEQRYSYLIRGAVQGVGFRPFIYHLAMQYGLNGWVRNQAGGLAIEAEGAANAISNFASALQVQKPAHAIIEQMESTELPLQYEDGFKIIESEDGEDISATTLPDLALCEECLLEMSDLGNRRYRYPFINCTHCGPRYTITGQLPFDRAHTSMVDFPLCGACQAEYENPHDRRFHAQAIACPECGPQLELWDKDGKVLADGDLALQQAIKAISDGQIVALKGLGGFHLIADAANEKAVQLLRARKHRKTKPFALMYPSLDAVKRDCMVSAQEAALLRSAAAPIVLLRCSSSRCVVSSVAPDNPYLGVMLPYTPLHALLLQALQRPIVATSGNRSGEPVCIDEREALESLGDIADIFLVHNRPILNRIDDSIMRIVAGREMILRRARGYAPLPIMMKEKTDNPILAVGGHLKNTIALAKDNRLILSPHIGSLDTPEAYEAHTQAIETLTNFYQKTPTIIAHDAHPDYHSTLSAQRVAGNYVAVQHHYAHALSCMIDNELEAPCFAVAWDGTGLGEDGTVWGGEFLNIMEAGYERMAYFLPFPLPGGEAAIRYTKRTALGVLYEMEESPDRLGLPVSEKQLLLQSLEKNINAPLTSSVGRLFDAVAAFTGLAYENSFEGEAAMGVEFAAMCAKSATAYEFEINGSAVDWRPMLKQLLADRDNGVTATTIAMRFHHALADIIVAVAQRQSEQRVLLTGGCFQNKLLLELAISHLREAGFTPFWHHRIPPNDGGLAAGQVLAAIRKTKSCV